MGHSSQSLKDIHHFCFASEASHTHKKKVTQGGGKTCFILFLFFYFCLWTYSGDLTYDRLYYLLTKSSPSSTSFLHTTQPLAKKKKKEQSSRTKRFLVKSTAHIYLFTITHTHTHHQPTNQPTNHVTLNPRPFFFNSLTKKEKRRKKGKLVKKRFIWRQTPCYHLLP